MKRPVCVSLRAWKKWQRIHKSGKNCKCIFRSNTIVIVNMSQAFTYKKTVKVNELKKNCWNSVCRVFQTKSKLLTWRFVVKRATKLTSAAIHGQDIYDILYFAYWRGEQIQFLKKVNKEQDFKIHYISFVCKERCLDFGLGCVNFCSLTAATEHICSINPFAPRQVIGGRFYHFKLKSVDEILWCYQYELSSFTKRLHGDVN